MLTPNGRHPLGAPAPAEKVITADPTLLEMIWRPVQSFPGAGQQSRVSLSTNQKIFRAALVVAFFSLIAKFASTAKELVVADRFGRSDVLDAFLIALLVPSFVVNLVAGSFNGALIPTFISVRDIQGKEAAQRLFSSVMVGNLVLLSGLSLLLGALAPHYLPLLGSGFDTAKLLLTRKILYILLPYVVLSALVTTWSAVLNAGERFRLPAVTPILTPIAIVFCLFVGGKPWGVFALAVGTVIGQGTEAALLARALRKTGLRLKPRWHGVDPYVRQVAMQCGPLLAGSVISGGINFVDQAMATMLAPGSVSALNYANRVTSMALGIGTLALSKAVLPYFSQMVAKQDWSACRHTLKTYIRLIALVTVPVTLGLLLFSKPLVRALFERGSFTAVDTNVVSPVLAFYSLQVPFCVLGALLVNVLFSLKRTDILLYAGFINFILNILLNLVFMKFMGLPGIALSTSVVTLASLLFVGYFVLRIMNENLRPGTSPRVEAAGGPNAI